MERDPFKKQRLEQFLKNQTKENISNLRSEIPDLFESFFHHPKHNSVLTRHKGGLEWKEPLGKLAAEYPEITLSEIYSSTISRAQEDDPKKRSYSLNFNLCQYEYDEDGEYPVNADDSIQFWFGSNTCSLRVEITNSFDEQLSYYNRPTNPSEEEKILLQLRDSLVLLRDERIQRKERMRNQNNPNRQSFD